MINSDLPVIRSDGPRPEFRDVLACREWLRQLPLTNVQTVQAELVEQMELLGHYPVAALERLKILEQLRETVSFLAGELGKRYRNKPVPFATLEQTALHNEQKLWQLMETGYRQCLQAVIEDDSSVTGFAALITQRVMTCIVAVMFGYGHAYRNSPASLWRQLHALYAYAEEQGFAAKRIKDSLNREDGIGSCEGTYAKALFLSLAGPQQLSSRQLLQIDHWLDKFAARATLSKEQPPTPSLTLVAVDLAGDNGAVIFNNQQTMGERRFLDTERAALSIRKRIKFLRGGGNPTEVGLGEDCVQPSCEALLTALYQRWCVIPPARTNPRSNAEGSVHVCYAFPAIYFFLTDGTPFKQPGDTLDVAPEIMQDMSMFGRVTERTQKLLLARLGYTLEAWSCLDESVGGFRISRSVAGERISQNQLVALRAPNAAHFNLAVIRWLLVDDDGVLSVGTHALPGVPTAIAARQMTLNPRDAGPFVPAFRLSEVTEKEEPASLVIPVGWYQQGKILQIYSDQTEKIKITGLLEKGANFERISYTLEPMY
jgi:cyclic-di-GMP-binding protein